MGQSPSPLARSWASKLARDSRLKGSLLAEDDGSKRIGSDDAVYSQLSSANFLLPTAYYLLPKIFSTIAFVVSSSGNTICLLWLPAG